MNYLTKQKHEYLDLQKILLNSRRQGNVSQKANNRVQTIDNVNQCVDLIRQVYAHLIYVILTQELHLSKRIRKLISQDKENGFSQQDDKHS